MISPPAVVFVDKAFREGQETGDDLIGVYGEGM